MPHLTNSLKNCTPLVSKIPENQLKHSHTYSTLLSQEPYVRFLQSPQKEYSDRRCFQKLTENNVSHYNRTQSIGLHILKNSDDILKGPILPTIKLRKITLAKLFNSRNFYHIRIHRIYVSSTFALVCDIIFLFPFLVKKYLIAFIYIQYPYSNNVFLFYNKNIEINK